KRESGYRPNAKNPSSTAYGLFQFLNSTWKGTGVSKTSDPVQQTVAGMRYIKQRYGSPDAAMSFWNRNRWY
ncbi:MAG: transglycosylase SLT domain-containing protein, partial [Gaiellales bacterium]